MRASGYDTVASNGDQQGISVDIKLRSILTVRDAMADYLEGPERTILFGVRNHTPFPIDAGFGKITSTIAATGWTKDTGLFAFGGPAPGSLPALFDPLTYHHRIYGQTGESSVSIAGNTLSDSYPPLTGPNYYSEITWDITLKKAAGGGLMLTVESRAVISTLRGFERSLKKPTKRKH